MDENAPHLIYFADPMCSWCWGFAPVMTAIHAGAGETCALPIRLILGGLRPGTTQPMHEKAKASTRSHWEHVHEASGQPFDFEFFSRTEFVYDTDPAARAVVTARRLWPDQTLNVFLEIQRAFYQFNRDVTHIDTLSEIITGLDLDSEAFRADFATKEAFEETHTDYAISQKTGVTGFPTLIAGTGTDNRYTLITQGYQPPEAVFALLSSWKRQSGLA